MPFGLLLPGAAAGGRSSPSRGSAAGWPTWGSASWSPGWPSGCSGSWSSGPPGEPAAVVRGRAGVWSPRSSPARCCTRCSSSRCSTSSPRCRRASCAPAPRLADEEGVTVEDVLVADASRRTTTLNAYVSGSAATRRDRRLRHAARRRDPGEVALGRRPRARSARDHDVLPGTALGALGGVRRRRAGPAVLDGARAAAAGRRRGRRRDPRVVALVLALVAARRRRRAGLRTRSVARIEARADRAALDLTRDPARSSRSSGDWPPRPRGPDSAAVELGLVRHAPDRAGADRPARSPDGAGGARRRDRARSSSPTTSRRAAAASRPFVPPLCDAAAADQVVVHTARMPGDEAYDAGLPFPVVRDPASVMVPTPAVGRRGRRSCAPRDATACCFGAARAARAARAALRAAGATRLVAMTHGHEVVVGAAAGTRQAAAPHRRRAWTCSPTSASTAAAGSRALSPPRRRRRCVRLTPGGRPRPRSARGRRERRCGGGYGIDRRPVVVCVSRLVARKGQDTLIAGVARDSSPVPGCRAARGRRRADRAASSGWSAPAADRRRRVHRRACRATRCRRTTTPGTSSPCPARPAGWPRGRRPRHRLPRGSRVRAAGGRRPARAARPTRWRCAAEGPG